MANLINSLKAFGEKVTGEKIEGETLIDSMKDMGKKMTGKEIEGNSLLAIIDETTEGYEGGGSKGGDIVMYGPEECLYKVNWQSVVDFMQNTLEIDVNTRAAFSQGISVPLFMCSYPRGDEPWKTEATINLQIYIIEDGALIGLNESSYSRPEEGLRGLYFDSELPTIGLDTTIKEAILALPTTLTRHSDGYNYMLMPYFDMVKIEE